MIIHTDKLTESDLLRTKPKGCFLEYEKRGSRSKAYAFKVGISAMPGKDAHGIARCYARNTGQYGGAGQGDRAATWVEWGDWMTELFKVDPDAVIGQYKGAHDFVLQTQAAAPYRPARENAEIHADRWSEEVFWAAKAREEEARA
jgi:hypothetical protein